MKYLFFSDVHGDASKLALLPIKSVDKVFFLGDVVGEGKNPNECINFLRSNNIFSIMGNHDALTTGKLLLSDFVKDKSEHTRVKISSWIKRNTEVLTKDNLAWLGSLPFKYEDDLITCVHANTLDFCEFIENEVIARKHLSNSKNHLFHGHQHDHNVLTGNVFKRLSSSLKLSEKSVIGVPSLTKSWKGSSKGYLILDTDSMIIELHAF